MPNTSISKEIIRYITSLILIFNFLKLFLITFLTNDGVLNQIEKNFYDDLERFLFLNFTYQDSLNLFLLSYSLLLTFFIFSSYWFNNPYLYQNSLFEIYVILFRYTTLFSVVFFYFFRIFNISRLSFFLYLLLLPILFISIRKDGLISKFIIRESKDKTFLHLYEDSSYGEEIFFINLLNQDKEVKKINLKDISTNYFKLIAELQKKESFNFILINKGTESEDLNELINSMLKLNKPIFLLSKEKLNKEIINFPIKIINVKNFNFYFISNKVQDGINFLFKRIIDILISILLLGLLSPLLLFLTTYIFIQDYSNPFIRIERSGLYGNKFKMFKFRTMHIDAHSQRNKYENINERKGPLFKIVNDPRIIKKLQWIRKFSFDELPQLINVLFGEMSLVGPRPLFSEDLIKFQEEQTIRLSVLPGITGLLQINARETEDFDTWFYWDKKYIENWSLYLDLLILFKTPFKLRNSN